MTPASSVRAIVESQMQETRVCRVFIVLPPFSSTRCGVHHTRRSRVVLSGVLPLTERWLTYNARVTPESPAPRGYDRALQGIVIIDTIRAHTPRHRGKSIGRLIILGGSPCSRMNARVFRSCARTS